MKKIFYCLLASLIISIPFVSIVYSETMVKEETTANDRTLISLSVYNNNQCMVREVREILLPSGNAELRFKDVANQVIPTSVRIASPAMTGRIDFLEQGYEYDLITPQNLLDEYVGHKIKLVEEDKETGKAREWEAELISNNQAPIYRINGEIHIGHPGRAVLPKLPDDMIAEPTLVWRLSAPEGGKYPLEVSYLTEGLDWEMDYSIFLNDEETRGDITGWVIIKNTTGISYENADIQLIAGDVNHIREPQFLRMKGAETFDAMDQGITEEKISAYHLYDLPEKITLKDNQTKQHRLVSADRIPIKKELRYYGDEQFYYNRFNEISAPQRVGVYFEFENKKTYHLGIPLPGGTVRVYKKDSKGRIQFLGEERMNNCPEDEKVTIKTGYAFDIVPARRQIDWRKISSDFIEVGWEITLRNQTKEPIWVSVIESVPGDWEVLESSHQWKKEEAHTLNFALLITPKGEEKIRYRVRIKS